MAADARDARTDPVADRLRRALPRGASPADRERLAELVERVSRRRVPVSSFLRLWTLGSLQARVTAGYLACWVRSQLGGAEERVRLKTEAHLAAALELFGTMGYLRGAVMKVGQLLANLPRVLPEEFAEVLAALHFEAPPMHYPLVREVFLDELGREPEEVFASFDRNAFAAASLGQVHRARLRSGEEVAVKIQYPGIARTIEADLKTLRALSQPLRLTGEWERALDKLTDVEQMLLAETDYEQEARFGREARALFNPEDQIVVPRVYDAFSTRRVLTTEYLAGRHLTAYLDTAPSQEDRDRFTHLLVLATLRPYYRAHWLFADPHPGNFLFLDDGRLGLLDFGCTRVLTDEEWRRDRALQEAATAGDEARVDRLIAEACLFDDPTEMGPERLAEVRQSAYWQVEPWLTEGPFDFGDEAFFRRGIESLLALARKRYTRSAPVYVWTHRFIYGSRAVAFRLGGRCRFRDLHNRELPPEALEP
ncbi:MAG: AarF/ABC1/UbiB kinase family protein [Deltaproteobacteria bacterium]|nr:AarF/ABC1/UbiB kinase family protein [Deltaproteobacteria bacterium]